jgi:putative transcriptional regulator
MTQASKSAHDPPAPFPRMDRAVKGEIGTSDPFELPEFVRDAGAEDPAATADVMAALAALSGAPAPSRSRERLLASVRELPLRYAPFYERLGALWDLPEERVCGVLTLAKDAARWQWTVLPGVRQFELQGGPRTESARVRLLKFSPGVRFPRHRHIGLEHVFVLEGSYTDSDGQVVGPGDLQVMEPGSEHGLRIHAGEPCVAGLVQFGMEFTGPVLRWVSKLSG